MREIKTHIIKEIRSSNGSDEGGRLYVITTIHSGETEVVLEKTIKKRMPIQQYEEAELMYERLTGGGGRRVITIEDLLEFK